MYRTLNADAIVRQTEQLKRRIEERFPDRNLLNICTELCDVASHAKERAKWIAHPNWGIRLLILVLLVLLLLIVFILPVRLNMSEINELTLDQFLQAVESGVNDVIFLGAGVYFLLSIERRIKRSRAMAALHELRAMVHVIDMHQLTKDPVRILYHGSATVSSPKNVLTPFELQRYLDYCSEMLSLLGKIAALYIQSFDDTAVLEAVNEIESVTTSLSSKIWQKIMIIYSLEPEMEVLNVRSDR